MTKWNFLLQWAVFWGAIFGFGMAGYFLAKLIEPK